jgi:hypothetical protein
MTVHELETRMAVCPEYRRLADVLRAALERVYTVQKQREQAVASKDGAARQAAIIRLRAARRAARSSEMALDGHAELHGCGPKR